MNKINPFDAFMQHAIGLDTLVDSLNSTRVLNKTNYPPYDIVKIDSENYEIKMAVAGFGESDISISLQENNLTIEGSKDKEEANTIHNGISSRNFSRNFVLAGDVIVKRADVADGILSIKLEKFIPEEKKPKKIELGKDVSVKSFLAE
jgi:molecular chaperone IbpA